MGTGPSVSRRPEFGPPSNSQLTSGKGQFRTKANLTAIFCDDYCRTISASTKNTGTSLLRGHRSRRRLSTVGLQSRKFTKSENHRCP
jgi:hypothetical protein